MATSDKLNYLIGTKNAIKDAIVEKGVEVSETDTFRSYADKIKSIEAGGGGADKIYATNYSSSTPQKDYKVLVQEGKESGIELNKSITSATSTKMYPQGFIDNNTILGGFIGREQRRFQYVDGAWEEELLTAYDFNDVSSFFWVNDDGSIYFKPYLSTSVYSYLVTAEGTVLGKSNWDYLGSYESVTYSCKNGESAADVYIYYPDTNTYSEEKFIDGPGTRRGVFLKGNKILLINTEGDYRVYEIQEDGTSKILTSVDLLIQDANKCAYVGLTGIEPGDCVFCMRTGNTTPNCCLIQTEAGDTAVLETYVFNENYELVKIDIPELQWLQTVNCRVSYDVRNNILMVGTATGVFAYEFDTVNKTFSEYPLNLDVGEIYLQQSQVYRAYMSPDRSRVLVTLRMVESAIESVTIYQLGEEGYSIVDNKTLNYQPTSVYTGFATGNVDEEGKYEVETFLGKNTL